MSSQILRWGLLNNPFVFGPIQRAPLSFFPLARLKPPACSGKQMLSRLYYFSKHSYPLPCYFLWSARLAALTFFPPHHPLLLLLPPPPSDQRADTQWLSRFWNSDHLFSVIGGQEVHGGSDLLDSPLNLPSRWERGSVSVSQQAVQFKTGAQTAEGSSFTISLF